MFVTITSYKQAPGSERALIDLMFSTSFQVYLADMSVVMRLHNSSATFDLQSIRTEHPKCFRY